MSTPRAISGSSPIVTNSVVPMANPPMARARIARLVCRGRLSAPAVGVVSRVVAASVTSLCSFLVALLGQGRALASPAGTNNGRRRCHPGAPKPVARRRAGWADSGRMQAPVPEDVDYRQTSARPQWETLPPHVHEAVGRLAGSPVHEASPAVTTGFTGAYAGRVRLRDGRDVFVKAAGPATPHVHGALAQEARVLAALPNGIPAPELVGDGDSEDWRVLVLGVIDGNLPGHHWTPAEVEAAHEACLCFAEAGTPAPSTLEVGSIAGDLDDPRIHSTAQALGGGTFALPPGIPGWLRERGPALADVAGGASRLAGQSLVHGDLR